MMLIHIIGGVSLLLWGVKLVSSGLNRACGASLRRFITKSTKNRVKGLLSGTFIAMALQSSTAVALITASFASKGLISTVAGISLMLGADIGTTLAAQILIFDLTWLIPVMLTSGYIMTRTKSGGGQYKHIGSALLGIGLVLLSLQMIVEVSEPLRDSTVLQVLIKPLTDEPLLALLFGGMLTWLVHSSLAMVLLFASFAGTGAIPVALGIVLVLGANLGSAMIAFFDTLTEKPAGRRIPLGNVIIRSTGVLLVLPFVFYIPPLLSEMSENPARMLVNFHTAFNITLALLMLPFVQVIAALTKRLLPNKAAGEDKNQPRYLDYTALDTPAAALASAERETLRMSDTVSRMLSDTLEVFRTDNSSLASKVHNRDNRVDILYDSIKKYLARITRESLNDNESQRHLQIMTFSTNLEHIGDIIDKSLLELADKKIRNHLTFSREGFSEINEAYALVIDNLTLAQHVFMTNNLKMARQLFQGKIDLRKLEVQTSEKHMRRLREGVSEAHSTTSLHLDIFRDLLRIQSYLTMIAYPRLESAGELYKSRLKNSDSD